MRLTASVVISGMLLLCSASVAVAQPPNAPTGLNFELVEFSPQPQIRFHWTAPSGGPLPMDYVLVWGAGPGLSSGSIRFPAFLTSYIVPYNSGQVYFFRLYAVNASGWSPPSNEIMVNTCDRPSTPQNVSWRVMQGARTAFHETVQVMWTADVGSCPTTFTVEVGTGPGLADVLTAIAVEYDFGAVRFELAPGTYYGRVVARTWYLDAVLSSDIKMVIGPPLPGRVLVNELGIRSGTDIVEFIEVRNIGTTALDFGGWRFLTGLKNLSLAGIVPAGTMLAPGCTYVIALPDSGLQPDLTANLVRGIGVVDPDLRIHDSAVMANRRRDGLTDFYSLQEGAVPLSYRTSGSYERRGSRDTDSNETNFDWFPTPTPQSSSRCGPQSPPPPTLDFTIHPNRDSVILLWQLRSAEPAILDVRLEIGLTAGATTFGPFVFAATDTGVTFSNVPPGTYYARLRARNAIGLSPASNEVAIVLCVQNCVGVPGAVTQLTYQVSGRTVLLAWQAPTSGGTTANYVIEAGTGRGLSDIGHFPIGSTNEFVLIPGVPAGTYYVRVRAVNEGGWGPLSNEVVVVVP